MSHSETIAFSGNAQAQGQVTSFLKVASVLMTLSLFPLAAYFATILSKNNPLDQDPIVEAMVLTILVLFAGVVLVSLCKIQWNWGHSMTGSSSTSVLGPLIWQHGHHPASTRFQNHEICIRGKSFCCGCTGAAIGVILGSTIIGLNELTGLGQGTFVLTYFGGLIFVATALVPYGTKANPIAPFRLLANILLPVGLSLVFTSARLEYPASNLVLLLGGLNFAMFLLGRIWFAKQSHHLR